MEISKSKSADKLMISHFIRIAICSNFQYNWKIEVFLEIYYSQKDATSHMAQVDSRQNIFTKNRNNSKKWKSKYFMMKKGSKMGQKAREKILIYLKELIDEYIKNNIYEKEIIVAKNLHDKFPDYFKGEKSPTPSAVSKYMKDIGYAFDNTNFKYEELSAVIIDDKKLECFDQPVVTVIKTALEDAKNIKESIYANFKEDIIFIKEETTEDAGILIIYSTKYNLGSAFNALVEESTEEYYGTEKEED